MPGLRRCCALLLLLPPQGGELTVRHQGQQRSYFRGGSPSAASKCCFAAFYAGEQSCFGQGVLGCMQMADAEHMARQGARCKRFACGSNTCRGCAAFVQQHGAGRYHTVLRPAAPQTASTRCSGWRAGTGWLWCITCCT